MQIPFVRAAPGELKDLGFDDGIGIVLDVWLMAAAVGLSLTEIMLMELALDEALDKYDAEIEGRQYKDIRAAIRSSIEEQRVESTGGIRGAMFDPETAAILQANAMRQATAEINPELADLPAFLSTPEAELEEEEEAETPPPVSRPPRAIADLDPDNPKRKDNGGLSR